MGSGSASADADARARTRAGNARALAARRAGPGHRAAVAAAAGAGAGPPGRVTLEGIAAELEARGVPAPGGGRRWSAVAVARVLGALPAPGGGWPGPRARACRRTDGGARKRARPRGRRAGGGVRSPPAAGGPAQRAR
jgi:hypothetical protein